MDPEFKSLFLLSVIIAILLSLLANHKVGGQTPENDGKILKDNLDRYLLALEKCDMTESSLVTLTMAIKHLIAVLDFRRQDEYLATLFAMPALRRDVFPGLEYQNPYKPPGEKRRTLNVLIHRRDGTLFSFNQHAHDAPHTSLAIASSIFQKVLEHKGKSGIMKKEGYTRDIKHTVIAGLKYARAGKDNVTLSASYLCDSFDLSKALNVTV